jgi:hypothetical protein
MLPFPSGFFPFDKLRVGMTHLILKSANFEAPHSKKMEMSHSESFDLAEDDEISQPVSMNS